MVDSIIFDSEGVVIDTESIWDEGQKEFLRRRGFTYDREKVKHLLTGASLADGAAALMREYGFSGDPVALARERLEIVRERLRQDVKFISGFREFFARVRHTFKTCIATAMEESLLKIVDQKLRLSEIFDGRIFSLSHVGFRSKPNPDLFFYAAKQLGSKPENCIVIEDAPFGVEAAKRAGMGCIAITTTYPRHRLTGADLVVHAYSEIDVITLRKQPTVVTER